MERHGRGGGRRGRWALLVGLLVLAGLGLGLGAQAGGAGGVSQTNGGGTPTATPPPVYLGGPDPYLGIGNTTPIVIGNSLPPNPVSGGGCPNCFPTPVVQGFWVGIDGHSSNHSEGDAYNTAYLGGYVGGCPNANIDRTNPNPLYTPPPGGGYNYRIKLDAQGSGPIEVYSYDPAQYYRRAPYPPTDPDTSDREECQPSNLNSARPYRYATTFILYYPDTTPDDFSDDVPVPGGSRTFTDTTTLPDPHNKWFRLGTVTYDPVGDYRLQVLTDNPDGIGRNQYALALGGPRAPLNGERIYPIDHMSLFNNIRTVPANQPIEYPLAYVANHPAGQRMTIRLYDIGDATCATSIQVLTQDITDRSRAVPVQFQVNWTGPLTDTLITTTSGGQKPYDGQWVTLGVRVPATQQASWWKIGYTVGSSCRGTSTDRTIWEVDVVPDCGWQLVASPNEGAGANALAGVAAPAANDAWAVGGYTDGVSITQSLVQHWDGADWSITPSFATATRHNALNGVAALTANDVWTVGWLQDSGNVERTLTLHWDGSAWNWVPSPNAGGGPNTLTGVAAVAANDVWAVGSVPGGTLTLHWDGTTWSVVPSPNMGGGVNILTGVAARAANDVWAVGSYYTTGGLRQTLILHWNGSAWSVAPSPNLGGRDNDLWAVTALAANDAWAVGAALNQLGYYEALALHWDGQSWSLAAPPHFGSLDNILYGVDAVGPNDVWAVGTYVTGSDNRPLALHWDGQSWSLAAVPSGGSYYNLLKGVAARAADDVWAAGYFTSSQTAPRRTLIEHYSGSCVILTPTPTVPPTGTATPPPTATGTPTPGRTPTATPCAISFSDVDQNHPFYAFIRCLACRGILSGYADGTFRPGNNVTRGQTSKIVSNAAAFQNAIPSTQQTFTDVPASGPFWLWVERLAGRGLISGYPCGSPGEPCDPANRPYFRPNTDVTRGQLAKIDSSAAGYSDPLPSGQQTFADVPPAHPFWEWIERVALHGVISGYTCGGPGEPCDPQSRPYFRAYAPATRGQTAKIVANTFFSNCTTSNER